MVSAEELQERLRPYSLWTKLSQLVAMDAIQPGNPIVRSAFQDILLSSTCTGFIKNRRPESMIACLDQALVAAWQESADQQMATELVTLEARLNHAKNITLREMIRQCHNDLGDFFRRWGKPDESYVHYIKGREYCSDPQQQLDSCIKILAGAFDQRNWIVARQYIGRATELASDATTKKQLIAMEMVLSMSQGDYATVAAKALSLTGPLEAGPHNFLSSTDISLYGALSILAIRDRDCLSKILISGNQFGKHFLVLLPVMKNLFQDIKNGIFSTVFPVLASLRERLVGDIFVDGKYAFLVHAIQMNQIGQYLVPYEVLSIGQVAEKFHVTDTVVEKIVEELIVKGSLSCKLDLSQRIILKVYHQSAGSIVDDARSLIRTHLQNLETGFIHLGISQVLSSESKLTRVTGTSGIESDSFMNSEGAPEELDEVGM